MDTTQRYCGISMILAASANVTTYFFTENVICTLGLISLEKYVVLPRVQSQWKTDWTDFPSY